MEGVEELIKFHDDLELYGRSNNSKSDIVRMALGVLYAMEISNRDMVCGYRRMYEI